LGADVAEHAQGVVGDVLESDVPVDGGDGDEFELGMGGGREDRDRVVRTGVAVEDELGRQRWLLASRETCRGRGSYSTTSRDRAGLGWVLLHAPQASRSGP